MKPLLYSNQSREAFRFEIPEDAFFYDDEAALTTEFNFEGGSRAGSHAPVMC